MEREADRRGFAPGARRRRRSPDIMRMVSCNVAAARKAWTFLYEAAEGKMHVVLMQEARMGVPTASLSGGGAAMRVNRLRDLRGWAEPAVRARHGGPPLHRQPPSGEWAHADFGNIDGGHRRSGGDQCVRIRRDPEGGEALTAPIEERLQRRVLIGDWNAEPEENDILAAMEAGGAHAHKSAATTGHRLCHLQHRHAVKLGVGLAPRRPHPARVHGGRGRHGGQV